MSAFYTMMNAGVWQLLVDCGRNWLSVRPGDLTYFSSHFVGKHLPSDWVPPPLEIFGKSKKAPDFVSWMMGAPVVSERVYLALKQWEGEFLQFLPFHDIKSKKYFAMNVLALEKDALDEDKSEILYVGDDKKHVAAVRRAVFKEGSISSLPPIFKLSIASGGRIYVSTDFCKLVIDHEFTGAYFFDSTEDIFKLTLKGKLEKYAKIDFQ